MVQIDTQISKSQPLNSFVQYHLPRRGFVIDRLCVVGVVNYRTVIAFHVFDNAGL